MRLITVRVIPNAKKDFISQEKGAFKIHVRAPAINGRANARAVEILADFFDVRKGGITIIKGHHSREKIIKIESSCSKNNTLN